jgi:hypothetical protein
VVSPGVAVPPSSSLLTGVTGIAACDPPPSVVAVPVTPPMMPAPGFSLVPSVAEVADGMSFAGSVAGTPAPIPVPFGVPSDAGGMNVDTGSSAVDPAQPTAQTNAPAATKRITTHTSCCWKFYDRTTEPLRSASYPYATRRDGNHSVRTRRVRRAALSAGNGDTSAPR